ncbi:MAG TPA: glycerol-3-phosphate acyltransferase [Mycobacteriales bacterium]|nr:glycerol-3-phosphate acyltransferase [Mycobacteriales bacterium]
MSWGWLAAGAAVGYLVGALSPATLLARRRGVDLASTGSGNPGATNVGRALGRLAGVVVGLLDLGKGAVPAAAFGAADHRAGLLAGFAAVLGHVTSPFLRGRGGRGVATSAGAVLGSRPLLAPILLGVWAVTVLASRWVTLGSIVAALALPVAALLLGYPPVDLLWAVGLTAVVVYRHQSNIRARIAALRARRRQPG